MKGTKKRKKLDSSETGEVAAEKKIKFSEAPTKSPNTTAEEISVEEETSAVKSPKDPSKKKKKKKTNNFVVSENI